MAYLNLYRRNIQVRLCELKIEATGKLLIINKNLTQCPVNSSYFHVNLLSSPYSMSSHVQKLLYNIASLAWPDPIFVQKCYHLQ